MSLPKLKYRILIVDDEPSNVVFLERLLAHGGYENVKTAMSGEAALAHTMEVEPDLILLDLHMPGIDGYVVLDTLRKLCGSGTYVPILVYTADITHEARMKALELGASDFLTKPADAHEILLRVRNFLAVRHLQLQLSQRNESLESKVRQQSRELEASDVEIVERLAVAGEQRDDETGSHTLRVGQLSASIAEDIGLPGEFVRMIKLAARLHDLGKIGVPDSILRKPGRLTTEERKEMQTHCVVGEKILAIGKTPLLEMAARIARSHHERFDGTGYPDGLSGEEIPIEARIVAVADVFDALTHSRPYKQAWDLGAAIVEIKSQSGRQFDPQVVQAFLSSNLGSL